MHEGEAEVCAYAVAGENQSLGGDRGEGGWGRGYRIGERKVGVEKVEKGSGEWILWC